VASPLVKYPPAKSALSVETCKKREGKIELKKRVLNKDNFCYIRDTMNPTSYETRLRAELERSPLDVLRRRAIDLKLKGLQKSSKPDVVKEILSFLVSKNTEQNVIKSSDEKWTTKTKEELTKMILPELKLLAKHHGIYKGMSTLNKENLINRILHFQDSKETVKEVTQTVAASKKLADEILTKEQMESMTIKDVQNYAKKMQVFQGLSKLSKEKLIDEIIAKLSSDETPTPKEVEDAWKKEERFASQKKYYTENKNKVAIHRLMLRVKAGSKPYKTKIDELGVTPTQVNLWRAEAGLEPITFSTDFAVAGIPRAKAILAVENQDKAEIEAAKRLEKSAKDIYEAKTNAVAVSKKVNEKKIHETVNLGFNKLSMAEIQAFFEAKSDEDPKARSIGTVNKYVRDLTNLFRDLTSCTFNENILPCINKDLIKAIDAKYDNPNTLNSKYKALSTLLREFPGIKKHIADDVFNAIQRRFNETKVAAEAKNTAKVDLDHESFAAVKEKVLKTFKQNSLQDLLINLYDEFNARDDFGDVILIADEKDAVDQNQNYMIYKKPVRLILRVYKTDKKYGEIKLDASPNSRIYDILKAQKKRIGDLLISKPNGKIYGQAGALSSIISNMLDKANVNRFGQKQAINLLRSAKKTQLLSEAKTAEDRALIAKNAMHSPLMQLAYMRKLEKQPVVDTKVDSKKPEPEESEPVTQIVKKAPAKRKTTKTTKKQ
jgi:hypothetical protein